MLVIRLLPSSVEAPVVCESGVIKPTVVEIGPMISLEEGAIVFEVEPVPVVSVPGGIIIISISGEIGFDDCGSGIVAICIYGSGGYIDSWNRDADVGAYVYLCIAFGSDEAGGYDGGEDEYFFHICSF